MNRLCALLILCAGSAVSARAQCFPTLPPPYLQYNGSYNYAGADGLQYTSFLLDIMNKVSYPDVLFEPAPDLPPCGLNSNSSRTWVEIFSSDGTRLYGFCGLRSARELNQLSFFVPLGQPPPEAVYALLIDRRCNVVYPSTLARIADLVINNYLPAGSQPAAGGRTYWTWRAGLFNVGKPLSRITAKLTSLDPFNIRVVPGQDELIFAPVPAGIPVISSNTFSIISQMPIDPTKLQWTFTTTPSPPIALVGPGQTVPVGANVLLNGSASMNPSGIGSLAFDWHFLSRPSGTRTRLYFPDGPTPSFLADVAGTYLIELILSNGAAQSRALVVVVAGDTAPPRCGLAPV